MRQSALREAADDPKLRQEKTNRVDLIRRAWTMLESFLTAYPEDPAADAIREYHRVADRFPDAKEAIDYFVHKAIALDEVTTVKPGEPVEVELKFRNIPSCDAKVYRIDLMKFSLLKRNLGGITGINLAGIQPYHETTVQLGDGKDYRDRTHKLPLPLKDEGAYLVVCRGENLHASGLVLVTPLAVEVQEDVASGRVRTTVKDTTADRYVSDVHVKVIGSGNAEFVSGSTDLRGVFVADGIQGTSTVIAQAPPSRYAFFRGETPLAMPLPEAEEGAETAAPAPPAAPEQAKAPAVQQESLGAAKERALINEQLLKGLQETNTGFQTRQVEQLREMYQAPKAGVQASEAF